MNPIALTFNSALLPLQLLQPSSLRHVPLLFFLLLRSSVSLQISRRFSFDPSWTSSSSTAHPHAAARLPVSAGWAERAMASDTVQQHRPNPAGGWRTSLTIHILMLLRLHITLMAGAAGHRPTRAGGGEPHTSACPSRTSAALKAKLGGQTGQNCCFYQSLSIVPKFSDLLKCPSFVLSNIC